MTPHFIVAAEQLSPGEAVLDGDDTRHLTTVLRARPGDAATVGDGRGTVWRGEYRGTTDGHACLALGEAQHTSLPVPTLTVVHSLPKQRKLDEVVQRLTEIGVDRIVPVHSERSQVHLDQAKAAKAVARWRAVAMAAAKQSRRAWLPEVADVGSWASGFADAEAGVVCWEDSPTGLRSVLDARPAPSAFVVGVGPEGGLTSAEVVASGLPHASLGRSILRTETAALVAVTAVRYHYGLLESR